MNSCACSPFIRAYLSIPSIDITAARTKDGRGQIGPVTLEVCVMCGAVRLSDEDVRRLRDAEVEHAYTDAKEPDVIES